MTVGSTNLLLDVIPRALQSISIPIPSLKDSYQQSAIEKKLLLDQVVRIHIFYPWSSQIKASIIKVGKSSRKRSCDINIEMRINNIITL